MAKRLRLMVTGGAGFIGSHLVERLLEDGHQVLVVDNFSTCRPENLAHIKDHPMLRIEKGDVSDETTISSFFQEIDWVFHLAALADKIGRAHV